MTFKPGQSGTPGGGGHWPPRARRPFSRRLLAELEKMGPAGYSKMEMLAKKLVDLGLEGDVHACRLIASYVDGLPHVAVSITTEDQRPLVEMTDAELMAIAARGRIDRDKLTPAEVEVISRAERVIAAHYEREAAGEAVADTRPPLLPDDDLVSPYGKGH
jgi:hypothetical protein